MKCKIIDEENAMKNRGLWIKFRRKFTIIIGVMGVLLNVIYICIYQSIDISCLINGLISVLLIVGGRYANRMSIDEELLCEEIYYLKKRNMSNEEIKSYLLIKYGQEVCEKVFKSDFSKRL